MGTNKSMGCKINSSNLFYKKNMSPKKTNTNKKNIQKKDSIKISIYF